MKILLVDASTYRVVLPEQQRQMLLLRLQAELAIQKRRFGSLPRRPGLAYSRGLLLIAAGLKQQGHDVTYVVYNDEKDRQRLPNLLLNADVLGTTALTPTISLAATICEHAKKINPSIFCVVGGPHIKAIPENTLQRYACFDVGVWGDGIVIFPKLVLNITKLADIPGIVYRNPDGAVIRTSVKPESAGSGVDVEVTLPAYELLYRPTSEYAHNIRTQEGCPYECDFCVERRSWSGKWNMRSIVSVFEELNYLSQYCEPGTLIHFSDAIFNLNKQRTIDLCEAIRSFANRFAFSIDTRVDLVDHAVIKSMIDAGIKYFRLGFEDAQDEILKDVHKGSTALAAIQAARTIREISSSSIIHAYWLTGLPGANKQSLIENGLAIKRLIAEGLIDIIGNKIFVPYPGTPYYRSPERYQMTLLTKDWDRFDRLSFPVYRLSTLTEFEIYYGFLFLESLLLEAYMEILGEQLLFSTDQLSYVYTSYVNPSQPYL